MKDKTNTYFNGSRYADPTAHEALKPIIRDENILDKRVNDLIHTLKYIADLAGFDLLCRIEVKDRKTGKEFR